MATDNETQDSNESDRRATIQVRIDTYWHRILKIDAAKAETTVRELLEACLAEAYEKIKEDYGLDE